MQLGRSIGCHAGTCRRKVAQGGVLTRPAPPPAICPARAPQQPSSRASVLMRAKRGSKRSKTDSEASDSEEASGWDAALANVPTGDDQADTSASEYVPEAAERTADQGPDASEPSTSYAAGSLPAASEPRKPRPPSSVLSLAEYNLLMEAKAVREAREAAEQKERDLAAGTALVVPEVAPLEVNRQGFQVFPLDGGDLELLVAETVDGRLALADSYLATRVGEQQTYSKPTLDGDVPMEPLLFTAIPWVERGGSDTFKRKAPTNKVKKVYFLNILPDEDGDISNPIYNMDAVFCFDGKSRVLARSEVRVVGESDLLEPVLRIRSSGLTLEESYLLPDPIEISMNTAVSLADMSEDELAERLAELEREAEELDELDEAPDVPSVDNY